MGPEPSAFQRSAGGASLSSMSLFRNNLLGCAIIASLAQPGYAQDAKVPYPSMAPIEQYLMDGNAEIALARSAAPAAISQDAQVLVLRRTGYETAVEGKNGFVCVVERSWLAPFGAPEFWNPKIRAAVCYNPPAARSIVPATVKQQQWILAGLSKAQVIDSLKVAFANGTLHAPEFGSMAYMMAKGSRLNDAGNLAHVMFFGPLTGDSVWSAGASKLPFIVSRNATKGSTTLIVPIGKWSDGSAASVDGTPPTATATTAEVSPVKN